MKFKIIEDRMYGFNIKYKRKFGLLWRYVKSREFPHLPWRCTSKKEANAYLEKLQKEGYKP